MTAHNPESQLDPGIYLEVGVGGDMFTPNPTMLMPGTRGSRQFVDGAHYVGVDYPKDPQRYWIEDLAYYMGDEEALIQARTPGDIMRVYAALRGVQNIIRSVCDGESIQFMVADGERLPLADDSVNEVYACDVFGSQLKRPSIERLVTESHRVLRPGGRLVVRECFTPRWNGPENLRCSLEERGLRIAQVVKFGSAEYETLAGEYGTTQYENPATNPDFDEHAKDMYFCVATKA